MTNRRQPGFAVVELLLTLVLVTVVAFTGYYVWSTKKSTEKTLNVANDTAQSTSLKKTATPKSYLTIAEWGVKVPLSLQDEGAYYSSSDSTSPAGGNPTYLNVYAKEADAIVGPSGASCKGEYIAFLMRLPTSDPLWSGVGDDDSTSIGLFTERKQIGDYTYAIATKKQYGPDCFNSGTAGNYQVDDASANKFAAVVNAFKSDFQKVSAK